MREGNGISVRAADETKIAQRFSAGRELEKSMSPQSGRLNSRPFHGLVFGLHPEPTDKSVGYCQSSASPTETNSTARNG